MVIKKDILHCQYFLVFYANKYSNIKKIAYRSVNVLNFKRSVVEELCGSISPIINSCSENMKSFLNNFGVTNDRSHFYHTFEKNMTCWRYIKHMVPKYMFRIQYVLIDVTYDMIIVFGLQQKLTLE